MNQIQLHDLQLTAKLGTPDSAYALAQFLWNCEGYSPSLSKETLRYFEIAANGNHPEAAFFLYEYYQVGLGNDAAKAAYYLDIAVEAEHAEAKAKKFVIQELARNARIIRPQAQYR